MQSHIRNFAIIAHIDHGKSTLADRLLEMTGTVSRRDMQEQILDSNPIERERGITIKLAPVRMKVTGGMVAEGLGGAQGTPFVISGTSDTSDTYILNLIDTPGHVDFTYEVSRSLAACEGAILVVDASQGIQAQTLANLHLARQARLAIIPVINKIDLPNARISDTRQELVSVGFGEDEIIEISAKTGKNIDAVLSAIIDRIPAPIGKPEAPLRALVFSSHYDSHKGVVVFVRVVDGLVSSQTIDNKYQTHAIRQGPLKSASLRFLATGAVVAPIEVGYFNPAMRTSSGLATGEVGYIATGIKDAKLAKVGDTITQERVVGRNVVEKRATDVTQGSTSDVSDSFDTTQTSDISDMSVSSAPSVLPLPGYKDPKPMVFLSLFPVSSDEYEDSRDAMIKLRLSDSAFTFRPVSSLALGNGFHCGFLGLLHAEVVQERILREFGLTMIATAPSVEYRLRLKPGVNPAKYGFTASQQGAQEGEVVIQSASEYPDPSVIESVREPVMRVEIYTPKTYIGPIMALSQEKRAEYMGLVYEGEQAHLTYVMPLAEMIVNFFDRLKSVTEGYASLDYSFFDWADVDVVRVDILLNHEKVDALSFLAVRNQTHTVSRLLVEKLADVIPRQQFTIPVQAAIGGQVVARSDVKAFRKDVTKKLYGGDRTRKDKLLDKQKRGKARMKMVGRVEIPQSAFFDVLRR